MVIKSKYKPEIDIVQADTELKAGTMQKMQSSIKTLSVVGRGGTDFQCVIDYLRGRRGARDAYSGVIIFTDGYVGKPKIPETLDVTILWAINEKSRCEEMRETFRDKKNLLTHLEGQA